MAACAGLTVAAWLWPPAAIQAVAPPVAVAPPAPAAPQPDAGGWRTTILGRPLFSASRRPDEAAPIAVARHMAPPVPRLSATMVAGGERVAVLVPPNSDHGATLHEGGELDGWHVVRIMAGAVVMDGPYGRLTVRTVLAGGRAGTSSPVAEDGRRTRTADTQDE